MHSLVATQLVNIHKQYQPDFLHIIFHTPHEVLVGVETKLVQTFTKNYKDKLWETNIFNTDTPQGLQNQAFFYLGKMCCLRGGQEQHIDSQS